MLFMAKNDILPIFHFSHFPNELKKCENGIYLWAFSIFPFLMKNEKTEN